MAGRFRVVTARLGEFGDLDGERESLETKDGDRESLETKDGDRESLETKDGERESLETMDGDRERMETSRARQECRVQKTITELHRTLDSPVSFGPGEEVPHFGSGAAHRRATSITGISGTAAVGGASIGSDTRRTSGSTRRHGFWTRNGEIQRAMRKREITVPGGPI